MRKVSLLGAILFLGLAGSASAAVPVTVIRTVTYSGHPVRHQPRYFWPAMDTCTFQAAPTGGTAGSPTYLGQTCTVTPAHFSSTPPPAMAGIPVNSPQAIKFNANYCPYGKDGQCPPS